MISMYYSRSDGHNNIMNCFLSMKSTMTMMIFVAIATTFISSRNSIHSINAFSSSKNNISILSLRNNNQRVLQQQQPVLLFAEPSKNSRTDHDNLDSNNNNDGDGDGDTLIVLDWDLSSLLSSDPAMDARFSPLMDVYDAAATCAATVVSNSVGDIIVAFLIKTMIMMMITEPMIFLHHNCQAQTITTILLMHLPFLLR